MSQIEKVAFYSTEKTLHESYNLWILKRLPTTEFINQINIDSILQMIEGMELSYDRVILNFIQQIINLYEYKINTSKRLLVDVLLLASTYNDKESLKEFLNDFYKI